MSSATVTRRQLILVEQWTCSRAPAVTIGEFRQAPLCMQVVLYKKYKLAMQVKSCRVTVTKRACENLAYATRWKITDGSLHFSTTTLHPFRDYPTKERVQTMRRMPLIESATRGSSWTLRRRNGQKQRAGRGGDRGGNPLSAELCSAGMYRRLFAHVTWLATAQRAVWHRQRGWERRGGNKMDLLRGRLAERRTSCTTNRRSFFRFSQF